MPDYPVDHPDSVTPNLQLSSAEVNAPLPMALILAPSSWKHC
jgi:hypothetical protein